MVKTAYKIETELPFAATIALVADLHEQDSVPVLQMLQSEKVDVILAAGDFLERRACWEDSRNDLTFLKRIAYRSVCRIDDFLECLFGKAEQKDENTYLFFREAAKLAPTVYSLGNHEWQFDQEDAADVASFGVRILDNQDIELELHHQKIRIGGLSTRMDLNWLSDFSKKDGFKILMSHHPEYYAPYIRDLPIPLVVSGHAHGGQIALFGHGLFAPGQGFFPKYCRGVYENRMIVSAGCANTAALPRFGNPCEVVFIHLIPQK